LERFQKTKLSAEEPI
jgi:hypothetical protein